MPEGMVKGPETDLPRNSVFKRSAYSLTENGTVKRTASTIKYTKRGSAQHLPFASEQGRAWRIGLNLAVYPWMKLLKAD